MLSTALDKMLRMRSEIRLVCAARVGLMRVHIAGGSNI